MADRAGLLGRVLGIAGFACTPLAAKGLDLKAEAGYFDMTNARQSAKAVFDGAAGGLTFGIEASRAFGRLYVSAGARYFAKGGERVYVSEKGSPAFRTGFPLSVRIVPIRASFGYRFAPKGRLLPYVGAGGGLVLYREESEVVGEIDAASVTKLSVHALAGVELGRGRIRFAAEVGYSVVPSALGVGGVSSAYGEKDIGGLSLVAKVVFGRPTPPPSPRDPSVRGSSRSHANPPEP